MITREQLQDILAHDGPHDIWVINADGSIAVLPPDTDLGPLQDPATWPRYFTRSDAIDNLVLGNGWEWTVSEVNKHVATVILGRPPAKVLAERVAATLQNLFKEKP